MSPKMNKREFMRLSAGAFTMALNGLWLPACKPKTRSDTDLKFLNMSAGFSCPGVDDRKIMVRDKYSAMIDASASEQDVGAIIAKMSHLPDVYLEYLAGTQGFKIFVVPQFPEPYPWAAGLCTGGTDGSPPQKVELKSFTGQGSEHVAAHELGHAVNTFVDQRSGARDQVQALFSEISGGQHDEAARIWDYGKQNVAEFFAVAFSSYYCTEARADMKASYPTCFALFSKILETPPEDVTHTPGATPTGPKPPAASNKSAASPTAPTTPTPEQATPGDFVSNADQATGQPGTAGGDADLAQLLAGIMGLAGNGNKSNGLGLSDADGRRLGIVQPLWRQLNPTPAHRTASEPGSGASIVFRVGSPVRVLKASDLQILMLVDGLDKPLKLAATFEQDRYVDHLYSARVIMPSERLVFSERLDDLERKVTVVVTNRGAEIGRREYDMLRRHVDGPIADVKSIFTKANKGI